ncbi:hypothetical protein [Brevundimonas sanguinis]|uniref:hypothetical protein n=1 Tax=Brevundimonas sanguinis TaxID=3021811 RepID=UPI002414D2F0|nr:hypothetical protein [Brevundimonas sp. NCCP 15609]
MEAIAATVLRGDRVATDWVLTAEGWIDFGSEVGQASEFWALPRSTARRAKPVSQSGAELFQPSLRGDAATSLAFDQKSAAVTLDLL